MGGFGKGKKTTKKPAFGNSRKKKNSETEDDDDDEISSLSDDSEDFGMGMKKGKANVGKSGSAKGKAASRFDDSETATATETEDESDSGGTWGQKKPAAAAPAGKAKSRGVVVESDSGSDDLDDAVGRMGFGGGKAGGGGGGAAKADDKKAGGARFESSDEESASEYTEIEEEYQVEVTDNEGSQSEVNNAAFDSDSDSMPEDMDFDLGDLADSGLTKGKGAPSKAPAKGGAAPKKTKMITKKRLVKVKKEKGNFGKNAKAKGGNKPTSPTTPAAPSWKEMMQEQEAAKEQEDPIIGVVSSLRQYLGDLRIVKDKMSPCFPPHP